MAMTPIIISGHDSPRLQKLPAYPTYQTVEQLIVHEKREIVSQFMLSSPPT